MFFFLLVVRFARLLYDTAVYIAQVLTKGKRGSAYRHRSQTVVAAAAVVVVAVAAGRREGRSRP